MLCAMYPMPLALPRTRRCVDRSCCCRALPSRRSASISTPVRAQGCCQCGRRRRQPYGCTSKILIDQTFVPMKVPPSHEVGEFARFVDSCSFRRAEGSPLGASGGGAPRSPRAEHDSRKSSSRQPPSSGVGFTGLRIARTAAIGAGLYLVWPSCARPPHHRPLDE